MKWLYKIFRLFKCPHKFIHQYSRKVLITDTDEVYFRYVSSCSRCGKVNIINRA